MIGLLCTSVYEPPILYIKSPAAYDRGYVQLPRIPKRRSSQKIYSTHSGEYVGHFVGQDALVGVDYASRLHEHAPAMATALEGENGGSKQQPVRRQGRNRHRRRQRHRSRLCSGTRGTGLRGGADVPLGQG